MTPGLTARTRLFALLGNPVEHSLSPVFQNAALAAVDADAVYVALRCEAASVPGLLRGIALAGGGGNVTVPHKGLAWETVTRRTEAAERTLACNTFWCEDGHVCGDNTDVTGFAAAASLLLGQSLAGARVLVAGAGGAARAVVQACLEQAAGEVIIVGRSPERARALATVFGAPRSLRTVAQIPVGRFDLAVNATPLGLGATDTVPFPDDLAANAGLDLVYARGGTEWVRRMRARGTPAADGTEMLLQQGAAAFARWFGCEPPVETMRRALERVS